VVNGESGIVLLCMAVIALTLLLAGDQTTPWLAKTLVPVTVVQSKTGSQ
jgi:hypothetical protein